MASNDSNDSCDSSETRKHRCRRRGRPTKYVNDEERKAATKEQKRQWYNKNEQKQDINTNEKLIDLMKETKRYVISQYCNINEYTSNRKPSET